MKIYFAGYLREIAGKSLEITEKINDSEMLLQYIYIKYPGTMNYSIKISIDGNLVREKTKLSENSSILVFTPVAGG